MALEDYGALDVAPRLRDGMIRIPGGTFRMGSDRHYPEEAPVHRVTVDAFLIDRTPVTNRQFKEFVRATGHVTLAEIPPDPKDYPGALPHMLYAGSLVFTPPKHAVDLRDWSQWWSFTKRADWRHPYGRKSNVNALDNHPVVHVCLRRCGGLCEMGRQGAADVRLNGSLPRVADSTARNMRGAIDLSPDGQHMANTWQGNFPHQNLNEDGFPRTSPVTAFPPNGYGVYDMIGNVWEWTNDWYSPKHEADAPKACCIPENPRGGAEDAKLRPKPAQDQYPAQGHQGRLASVRAELLPPLPSGRASSAAGRHVHQPHRLSLRSAHESRPAQTKCNDRRLTMNDERRSSTAGQHRQFVQPT